MAFFGLSSLGPQNVFVAARPETYNLTLFDMEEYAEAFDGVDRSKAGVLSVPDVSCPRPRARSSAPPLPSPPFSPSRAGLQIH